MTTAQAKAIKPNYTVNRLPSGQWLVTVEGNITYITKKKAGLWYAHERYFYSLRDAIIYTAYGVC